MSRYLERSMMPGERLLYAAEIHWVVYLSGIFVVAMGSAFSHYGSAAVKAILDGFWGGVSDKAVMWISVAIIAAGTMKLLAAYVRQISTELVITDRRVIAKYGLISTTTFELMLTKVEGANIDQTMYGRILGFGTVMVKGTGGGISPIDHVASPYRFHSKLLQAVGEIKGAGQAMGRND